MVALAEDGPLVDLLRRESIPVEIMPLGQRLRSVRKDTLSASGLVGQLRSIGGFAAYAVKMSRRARQLRADLIYTNSLKSDFYGGVAGRLAKVPVIWHVRDRIEQGYLPAATVRLVRFLARRLPSCVVANSVSTLETLRLPASRATEVIASGVTREFIAQCSQPVRGSDGLAHIGIIGRIAPWKGQDVFIAAAQQVIARGFQARFHIVGSALFGEERFETELRQQVARMGMEDYVEFAGFRDVPPFLRSLDILVHASKSPEPFGQVIVEGLAAQLPVIATDGGGAREIIEHGRTGLLVPMGNAQALAAAIADVLSRPDWARGLAAAGHRHVLDNYTVDMAARRSEALYRRLLAPRSP